MESFSYCHRSPSPTCLLPSWPLSNRRSLGPAHKLCRDRLCPDAIRSSALYIRTPAPPARATANAVNDFCTIAAASPAKSGDTSVFLQTSAVLLGAYWVTNFLVPDLISKYFGFDKLDKEDDPNKPDEDGSAEEGTSSSPTKGRGFNSTRS